MGGLYARPMEQTQTRPGLVTLDAYLRREEASDLRHEFHALPGDPNLGEALEMTGATRRHNLVVTNLSGLLWSAFRGGRCRVMANDMRVFAPGDHSTNTGEDSRRGHGHGDRLMYPDVLVQCGEGRFADHDRPSIKETTLLNPVAVFEVLSDSTELYDRTGKFAAYRNIESLQEYVLVHQDRPVVETFHRQPGGGWAIAAATGSPHGEDTEARLGSLGLTLALADLYEGIDLEEPPARDPG